MTAATNRIQYIDAMRGWAVFVMVWVHATWLSLGAQRIFMWSFAVVYPMPVFFAVAGYLWALNDRHAIPWKRWRKMIALLLAGSIGYALLFNVPVRLMFSGMYYYWFFTALLLCEICVWGMAEIARILNRSINMILIVGTPLLWTLFFFAMREWGRDRFGIPWGDMEQYWLFYVLGTMMGRSPRLTRLLTSPYAAAAGLILLVYGVLSSVGAGTPQGLAGGLGAVMITWHIFAAADGHVPTMAWLGRNSLGIFLLSYPMLKSLAPLAMMVPRNYVESPWQWLAACLTAIPAVIVMAYLTSRFKKYFNLRIFAKTI